MMNRQALLNSIVVVVAVAAEAKMQASRDEAAVAEGATDEKNPLHHVITSHLDVPGSDVFPEAFTAMEQKQRLKQQLENEMKSKKLCLSVSLSVCLSVSPSYWPSGKGPPTNLQYSSPFIPPSRGEGRGNCLGLKALKSRAIIYRN